ncbi:helix-turn-helix domain-containing protein [Hymenobacter negativus]|uniref:Helix-turn-helix domain-containing protein n=1 Tax=Hymenobacter negativus TaxID=2795026 RepID=A0ABS3QGK0_9BACT|nr:helix-turn-helix transcriptional regulator [Hymenobacter negativus]MBO2010236.1 helix-turn-helix domain-containing protein [Hymenobacter negativus]
MFSTERISTLRKSKGLSQEVLAEQSGVSLRTIQRMEQGDTVPRGHTLQALATALGVPLDALRTEPAPPAEASPVAAPPTTEPQWPVPPAPPVADAAPVALPTDPDFLQWLNLSALSFLVLPLLNVAVPWWLWRTRRHRIAHVAELGRRIVGFQVLWQVGTFFLMLLALTAQLVLFRRFHVALPELWLSVLIGTYAANVCTVAYYGAQLRQGRLNVYRYRL